MITGVILARNEERNIEACIKNLRPFVEQLIVIDMDSSDSTRRISERFADLVMPHPLIDDFDSARNIANEAATEPWLWFADADERVSKATGELVRQLVGSLDESFAAIQIPFKTYFCGQWIQHSGWWPGYTMPRVFRKGRFEFRKGVHQGVSVLGGTALLPPNPEIAIDHYSYLSIEHYYEKFNRYTTIEAKSLPNDGKSWNWRMGIRQMTRDLWHYYENCRGDMDGLRGWVLAWLAGQYRWAAHAKVLDLIGESRGEGEVPDDLTAVLQEMESEVARLRVRLPPREEIGLVLRSPIFDASGYADDGRFVAAVLSRLDHHFSVEEFRWRDDTAVLAPATESLLRALTRARPPQCRMTITNCIPSLVQPDPLAHLNVLRTTFETDRIPKEWLDQLDRFDEIWLFSEANRLAFLRGGAAPERIRIVPSGLDTTTFTPTGLSYPLPSRLHGRIVFLSIFDWQYRKGWDILLEAILEEFNNHDDVGLILKVTMDHGVNRHLIEQAIQAVIEKVNVKTQQRVAIEIITESLSSSEMSSLYRSVDAFVLPTRGEGWGRPFMEALACGTPVIATRGSGQQAFLDESCALLVDAHLTDVPEHAWKQVPTFQGHQWLEPNPIELRRCLRQIVDDAPLRQRLAEHGHAKVLAHYSIEASRPAFASAIDAACATWFPAPAPIADPSKVRVAIEGEFFAGHSFSNVNEEIARHLIESENLEVTILPLWQEHASTTRLPHLQSLKPYFNRDIGELEVTIRHSFPPKWNRPPSGRWIHIQPWEFGALPLDWVKPLRDEVDEIWLPSNYCREVYVNSGIPSEKIHVFPWGIDPVT